MIYLELIGDDWWEDNKVRKGVSLEEFWGFYWRENSGLWLGYEKCYMGIDKESWGLVGYVLLTQWKLDFIYEF